MTTPKRYLTDNIEAVSEALSDSTSLLRLRAWFCMVYTDVDRNNPTIYLNRYMAEDYADFEDHIFNHVGLASWESLRVIHTGSVLPIHEEIGLLYDYWLEHFKSAPHFENMNETMGDLTRATISTPVQVPDRNAYAERVIFEMYFSGYYSSVYVVCWKRPVFHSIRLKDYDDTVDIPF